MSDRVALRAAGVTKVFPGTVALDEVSFNAYAGKVNILVGENGAGKSTLMKIIAGAEQPTHGVLHMNGAEVLFRSPIEAQAHGIGIIYQELDLCPNMSVADNIFLAREIARWRGIDFGTQRATVERLLERLEHRIDPDTKVGDLGVSAQQIVAIAKALLQNVRVLIMDEPTSALTAPEVETLFRVIRELKNQGTAIIYISHRLEEVLQIGDHITVLRDGKVRAESKISDIDLDWIIEKMVGRSFSGLQSMLASMRDSKCDPGSTALRVQGLTCPRPETGYYFRDVTFELHSGEIVGLYGLMGAGRSELLECLMGLHPNATGRIHVGETALPQSGTVDERIAHGLFLVPEDRQAAGIVQPMTVADNTILASVRRYARGGVLPRKAGAQDVLRMVRELSIRVSSPEQPITALSGGNQQKVVVAKALLTQPKVLLLDEPTRGIDVNSKAEIFATMNELARRGIGILFASSELKEIMAFSDRVLVMARGSLSGEFTRGAYGESELVAASSRERVGDGAGM